MTAQAPSNETFPDAFPDASTPEILVIERWDGARAEYVTAVTLDTPDSPTLTIRTCRAGPYVGDYEVAGPDGFHSDGWVSLSGAIACATDHLLGGD